MYQVTLLYPVLRVISYFWKLVRQNQRAKGEVVGSELSRLREKFSNAPMVRLRDVAVQISPAHAACFFRVAANTLTCLYATYCMQAQSCPQKVPPLRALGIRLQGEWDRRRPDQMIVINWMTCQWQPKTSKRCGLLFKRVFPDV